MRLAVFGATGRTGKLLVEQALNAEYDVTAFVRPRSLGKLTIKHERLTVVQGDATDAAAVERAVNGADAVVSVMNSTWNNAFHKAIGYVGIVASIFTLGNYVSLTLASTNIAWLAVFVGVGGILMLAWWVLVGVKLYQLGNHNPNTKMQQDYSTKNE